MKLSNRKCLNEFSLLAVALFWGLGFVAVRVCIDSGMSSPQIVFLRFFIGAAVFYPLFHKRLKGFTRLDIKYGVTAGFFLYLGFVTQTIGNSLTTPSNNAFLTATNVLFVPFITWAIFKNKPQSKLFFCAALCLVGMFILTFDFKAGFAFNLGDLLTIACAVVFAAHFSYLSFACTRCDNIKLTFLQLVTSAAFSLVTLLILTPKSIITADYSKGIFAILFLGIVNTAFSYYIQTHAQKKLSSTKTSIILCMESLFGCLFSVLLGYDKPTVNMFLGGIIVIAAVILLEVDLPFWKKKGTPS